MQTNNNKFIITDDGRRIVLESIKSFKNTIIVLTPFYTFLNLLIAYRFTLEFFSLNFWLIFIFASFACSILTIYNPLRVIRKYNNIIVSIEKQDDNLLMTTFKSEEIKLTKSSMFSSSETAFILPKKQRSLTTCISFNGKSYFILKSFFNEYAEIQKLLANNIS